MKWYESGWNECQQLADPTGACCFPTGECQQLMPAECDLLNGSYLGDNTTCAPDNPCAQPGACCDPETGICTYVLEADCQPPLVFVGGLCEPPNPCPEKAGCCDPLSGTCTFVLESQCLPPSTWHPGWTCEPINPCRRPVATEPATWGRIKAAYR